MFLLVLYPPPSFEAEYRLFCGRRRVAVARYRMICLVLVNSHLFPLPCGAGSAVPREGFDLSVIILASLLVFSDVGLPSLFVMALSHISCFCQVECTYSNISTCLHLPVGGHYLVFLALSVIVLLQEHLFVDHF